MGSDMGLVGSRRAALFALMAVLAHVTINYVPLEYVVAAQQSAFATGTRLSPEEAVDAAVVLGYSVEAGTPTLPLVARVHLGVRLFCAGAARNIVFSGCALHPAPAPTAPPKRLPERACHLSPVPPGRRSHGIHHSPSVRSAAGEDAGAFITEANAMRKLAESLIQANHSLAAVGPCARVGIPLGQPRRVALHAAGASPGVAAMTDRLGGSLRVREMSGGGYIDTEVVETGGSPTVAPRFHWVLEESSTSTRENALFTLEECRRRGWSRVAVVTNRFHQFRAERVFRKAVKALGLEVVTARMPLKLEMTTQFPPPGWGALARVRELWRGQFNVLREMAAIALYAVQGWI